MAVYRNVHTSFWQDSFVLSLTPEEKYFYLYLFTNSRTTQCGVYELPIKVAELETGFNRETVEKYIAKFSDYNKVKYDQSSKEVMLKNWLKYNASQSPKVLKCLEKEIIKIKSEEFKTYCMDRVCIEWGEEEELRTKNKKKNKPIVGQPDVEEIISFLNQTTGAKYRSSTPKTVTLIRARFGEGFTVEDFKTVITKKHDHWHGGNMAQYLRPETLFGTKFESYLNEPNVSQQDTEAERIRIACAKNQAEMMNH